MRCRICLLLLVCGVLGTGFRAASAPAAHKVAKRKGAVTAVNPEQQLSSWTVTGYGESEKDAYQDALEKARAKVIAYLDQQNPPFRWTPPPAYVEDLAKRTDPVPTPEQRANGITSLVRLDVALTAQQYSDMREHDRRFRQKERLLFLAKVLAGLVAFFAAVAGYLRLDEATKGYYTLWLRLAAVGFAAAIAAGAWLLPFFKGRLTQ